MQCSSVSVQWGESRASLTHATEFHPSIHPQVVGLECSLRKTPNCFYPWIFPVVTRTSSIDLMLSLARQLRDGASVSRCRNDRDLEHLTSSQGGRVASRSLTFRLIETYYMYTFFFRWPLNAHDNGYGATRQPDLGIQPRILQKFPGCRASGRVPGEGSPDELEELGIIPKFSFSCLESLLLGYRHEVAPVSWADWMVSKVRQGVSIGFRHANLARPSTRALCSGAD